MEKQKKESKFTGVLIHQGNIIKTHKTRLDWFNVLTPDAKHKALANYKKDSLFSVEGYNTRYTTLELCLVTSFDLETCPEGYDYWREIITKAK